jgi:hypothetical protein
MKIDKQFILRKIAGDYVIIPTGKTALEFNGMITVNEQGAFLWQQLSGETTEEQLVDALLNEYDVDRQTAQEDVSEFLQVLQHYDILIN